MTARAVILGLLGACLICVAAIVNRQLIYQTSLVGNQLPIAVFGTLILFLLLINPLLFRLKQTLALTGKELAVIVAMTLAACAIPGSNFARVFTPAIIMPHHHQSTEPGWKSLGLVEMVPDRMLANVTPENETEVLGGYLWGLPRPKDQEHIRLTDIPWYAWKRTLSFWGPMILLLWIGFVGLSVVVHRQWSRYEQLAYPVATFAASLLPSPGKSVGGVFRQPLFWVAMIAVSAIHLNNYAHAWFPDMTIQIQREFDMLKIVDLIPIFQKGPYYHLAKPYIYFAVVAFAYFLASDVSLSLGIGPFFYCFVSGVLITYGISLEAGGHMHPRPLTYMQFGAFLAMFVGLVIMGRSYYASVFKGAIGLRGKDKPEHAAVWGARVFLVGITSFVGMLWAAGLDWQLAVLYGALIVILFVVLSRVVAETGFYSPEARWFPCVVMMGFLGPMALNPESFVLLMLVSVVLVGTPSQAVMPFLVNGMKLLDLKRIPIGRPAAWCAVTLVVAMIVSITVVLYIEYDRGVNRRDFSIMEHGSKYAFHETIQITHRLIAQDSLEEAQSITGWRRLAHLAPNGPYMIAFLVGAVCVASFTILRTRFARWPLHPVLFIMWGTSPGRVMAVSFLIGWAIKSSVTRYGGPGAYQKVKPLMIGLIAGDLAGSIIPLIIGAIIRITTDLPPPVFDTMRM
jgi:hypothetical protein